MWIYPIRLELNESWNNGWMMLFNVFLRVWVALYTTLEKTGSLVGNSDTPLGFFYLFNGGFG